LNGDLGDPNKNVESVDRILHFLDASLDSSFAVPKLILSGSGVGKTKVLFDLLKKRYGILHDRSIPGKDFAMMESTIGTIVRSKISTYEDDCSYQIYLTIAARGIGLLLYHFNNEITPEQWLYCQLNGLFFRYYDDFIKKIRHLLTSRIKNPIKMEEFCITLIQQISNYFSQRFVIAMDEANILLDQFPNTFKSSHPDLKRPLFSFVVDRILHLNPMLVVAGTRLIKRY